MHQPRRVHLARHVKSGGTPGPGCGCTLERPVAGSFFRSQYSMPLNFRNRRASTSWFTVCIDTPMIGRRKGA